MPTSSNPASIGVLPRIWRFVNRPWGEKAIWLRYRWVFIQSAWETFPWLMRLPFGAWWISRNDNIGRPLRQGQFETAQTSFVGRYLRPGMTVLDIGAHHGLYTLLSAMRVGKGGRVFSFEPSARERRALLQHMRLNRLKNVNVQNLAVGNESKKADFYVVDGLTGCNSLRPPVGVGLTSTARVQVTRLDMWFAEQGIERLDFIKLDVEGGEREALRGGEELLKRFRPVLLMEVQDIRTKPWGYRAKEIIAEMIERGYTWFDVNADGSLTELQTNADEFDGDFVAWPDERLADVREFAEGMSLAGRQGAK